MFDSGHYMLEALYPSMIFESGPAGALLFFFWIHFIYIVLKKLRGEDFFQNIIKHVKMCKRCRRIDLNV